jgi:hypothetical protein
MLLACGVVRDEGTQILQDRIDAVSRHCGFLHPGFTARTRRLLAAALDKGAPDVDE